MKSALVHRLVNGPFGDPGLFVGLRWQGRAIQLDLGRIGRMNPGDILRVGHVFVSHAHMDHFMGFDHLLRLFLPRDATIHLHGPEGFVDRVEARLAGYTWNLTESYTLAIMAHEATPERVRSAVFRASTGFRREDETERPFDGVLHAEEDFEVRAAILDHKIPCLAFAIVERPHLNVDKRALDELGLRPGRWLADLKERIQAGALRGETIEPPGADGRRIPDDELAAKLVVQSPGQKIGYVVDVLYSDDNRRKIVELVEGADVFYCEAPFLHEDVDQATHRYHLTARQAGLLAREAQVRRLEVFHFSPRYDGQADRIHGEARAAFRGRHESPNGSGPSSRGSGADDGRPITRPAPS